MRVPLTHTLLYSLWCIRCASDNGCGSTVAVGVGSERPHIVSMALEGGWTHAWEMGDHSVPRHDPPTPTWTEAVDSA